MTKETAKKLVDAIDVLLDVCFASITISEFSDKQWEEYVNAVWYLTGVIKRTREEFKKDET